MRYERLTNDALLALLLEDEVVKREYRGTLGPLFQAAEREPRLGRLAVAIELVRRYLAEDVEREALESPAQVKDFLVATFHGQAYESFLTIYLTSQHRVISAEESFRGSLNQTAVHPREIVRRALELNAGAVILAHNHPSGCAEPSRADEFVTQSVKSALQLVDVRVLDHMVVGGTTVTSFAERGLL